MKYVIHFQKYASIFILITLSAVALMVLSAKAEDLPSDALLQMAEDVSERAHQMAIKAKETKDYYQAQHAFALATEALPWIFEVMGMAQKTSNPKLAHAARNAANKIIIAITQARDAALEVLSHNSDPEVAHAVNFLLESCDMILLNLTLAQK